MGITNKPIINMMADTDDGKLMYHNASSGETQVYALHNCLQTSCQVLGDVLPGKMDRSHNLLAEYGIEGETSFFEMTIPINDDEFGEDVEIKEGTTFEIIINPYFNVYNVDPVIGHCSYTTSDLRISFEEQGYYDKQDNSNFLPGIVNYQLVGSICVMIIFTKLVKH